MPSATLWAFHRSSIGSCHPLTIHPLESMSAIITDESTESSKHKLFLSCMSYAVIIIIGKKQYNTSYISLNSFKELWLQPRHTHATSMIN